MPTEARCKGCGYQLRGLTEMRCPECGLQFDPLDRWSYQVPGRRDSTSDLTPDQGLLTCSGIGAGLFVLFRMSGTPDLFFPLGCICGLLGAFFFLRCRFARACANVCDPKRVRMGSRLLLLMILLLFHYGACRCGHARAIAFLNIGIGYSSGNGPCHITPFIGPHEHLGGHWWLVRMDTP